LDWFSGLRLLTGWLPNTGQIIRPIKAPVSAAPGVWIIARLNIMRIKSIGHEKNDQTFAQ